MRHIKIHYLSLNWKNFLKSHNSKLSIDSNYFTPKIYYFFKVEKDLKPPPSNQ